MCDAAIYVARKKHLRTKWIRAWVWEPGTKELKFQLYQVLGMAQPLTSLPLMGFGCPHSLPGGVI